METIRSTGYGAELPLAEESTEELLDAQDEARDEEVRDLRRKFVVSALVGAASRMLFGDGAARSAVHGRRRSRCVPAARRSRCRWSAGPAGNSTPAPGRPSAITART